MPRRSRASRAAEEEEVKNLTRRMPFDIPYFAHQQLDPEHFPDGVGFPIEMSPTRIAANKDAEDWDDPEDSKTIDCDEDEHSPGGPRANKNKRRRSSLGTANNDPKRLKITGGRPAAAKKVVAEMDSDDEIIFSMKNAKFLEKDIAKRLADEGRTVYNPKSIGSRWARLKQVMQAKQDELLDADLTDWHEGDDDVLCEGIEKANEYIKTKVADIEARRWRIVAAHVKDMKPVTNFSQNACRHRYEALQAGTAKPPPESLPNPSPAVLARIQTRRDRQERLDRDIAAKPKDEVAEANLEANAWTSRRKGKFS